MKTKGFTAGEELNAVTELAASKTWQLLNVTPRGKDGIFAEIAIPSQNGGWIVGMMIRGDKVTVKLPTKP